MVSSRLRKLRALGLVAIAALPLILSACRTCEGWRFSHGKGDDCPGHAKVCEKPTVRALAHDVDALEQHIERYGSVTIQQPSVWGQARLTKHREEFEKEMAKELGTFTQTLQGSLSRSDQAYFANATALSMAVSGPQATITPNPPGSGSVINVQEATFPIAKPLKDDLKDNEARLPAAIGFKDIKGTGISTEPSVFLNQKARYLNHLNELRRINEGDDTGDSPGYALNLIRIPVSLLPGKHTQVGHGAEVTMTLKPYLSDELLPTTFRNLVVNDLLEQLGVPLTQFLNDKEQLDHVIVINQIWDVEMLKHKNDKDKVLKLTFANLTDESKALLPKSPLVKQRAMVHVEGKPPTLNASAVNKMWANKSKVFNETTVVIPATKLRHAKRPFPPSQILDIYGEDEAENVVLKAIQLFSRDPNNKHYKHYPDVQGYLQEELGAAYRFLADPDHENLWQFCDEKLVQAIHTRNVKNVEAIRKSFAKHVHAMTKRDIADDVTVFFAWTIIVESALLNKQLIHDIKESAAAKKCPCPVTDTHGHDCWLDFYMPRPSPTARAAFISYVECRWPIIVFALDPVAEQQNIADSYSSRREMQLAMSMAFVSGQISAKNMTQYARKLDMEMETVALNNTVVGFSHGNETFGWRFYPRFQSPDTESNLTVLVRDQFIGGPNRNALLRQRKLEPGQRECTAIVIMPSFVPYATLEVASNWFSLTNPKHKDMTCVEAVKLSARVKTIQNCADNVTDLHCYRDGELDRLKARAKQLEARLPLQGSMVQVPYENTLGGFAMFNTGITDLAPELYGWYGAPGIDTTDTTTLFLVGNHFSVHQTRVVVGGIHVKDTEMLSRQVMRVTIPKGALTIDRRTGTFPECPPGQTTCPCPKPKPPEAPKPDQNEQALALVSSSAPTADDKKDAAKIQTPTHECPQLFVDVHIATPYGVTSHLLVPACPVHMGLSRPGPAASSGSAAGTDALQPATGKAKGKNAGGADASDRAPASVPGPILLQAPNQMPLAPPPLDVRIVPTMPEPMARSVSREP